MNPIPEVKHPVRRLLVALVVAAASCGLGLPLADTFAVEPESHGKVVVGYVFDARGKWLQNNQGVEQGESVLAGARITLSPANTVENPMIVVHLGNGRREVRSAEVPGSLKTPIELPESLGEPDSPLARVIKAVQAVFVKEPERYLPTMTRDGGSGEGTLQEAVAELSLAGPADLAPAFRAVPAGKYLLRCRQLSTGERAPSQAMPPPPAGLLPVDWNPSTPGGAMIAGLSPGLYRVSLFSASQQQPLGGPAWVLVCAPGDYRTAAEGFRDAVGMTDRWGKQVNREEVRAFLRAYLESLVGKEPAGKP